MNTAPDSKPPYPRIGEIYRCLANAFDTRSSASEASRGVDRLARGADFDYSLLSESAERLFREPLSKQCDAEIANAVMKFVEQFIRDYSGLVAAIALDSIDREEALPLLTQQLFASYGAAFLLSVHQAWGGPELITLLDPDTPPIATVIDWASANNGGLGDNWLGVLYPGSVDGDKRMRDLIGGWRRGAELPRLQSLGLLDQDLQRRWPEKAERIAALKRWLVVARAISWFEREAAGSMPAGITARALVRQELLLGVPTRDVGKALFARVREAGQAMRDVQDAGLVIMEGLTRATPKQAGDQDRLSAELRTFETLLVAHDPQGRGRYLLQWAWARWHVLSGRLAEALPVYEAAFDAALYRAGPNQKEICQELLVVAARLGSNKPVLKRVKNQAVVFGFFEALTTGKVLQEWEVEQFSDQFERIFPRQGRFAEVIASVEDEKLPLLVFDQSDVVSREPDLSKPDRVVGLHSVDGQVLRRPQLSVFVSLGQTEKVRRLIEAGAPVDQLDATGGTALLAGIQRFETTGDRGVLDLLLKQPHRKETLDSATHKKRLTPLLSAIECGTPDVVAELLRMGASPDRRGTTDDLTPLYHCMYFVAWIWNPHRMGRMFRKKVHQAPDAHMADTLRRYAVSAAGVYGDSGQLQAMANSSQRNEEIFDSVVASFEARILATHTRQKLLSIIEGLLRHGANPNAVHGYPIRGYTPLMLVAEEDAVEVFDLMVQSNGDPLQFDASGRNCIRIAQEFQSGKVLRYLQMRGIA